MAPRLELWRGTDAAGRLADPAFVKQWLMLCQDCPWATPFQHPAFVNTWYASYRTEGTPVVAAGFDEVGTLIGLLLLAEFDGRLVGAGAQQAEYQVWLARPEASPIFAARAILAVRSTVPGMPFQLKYVPGDAPIVDVAAAPEFRVYAEVIKYRRPLMRVDHEEITSSLRKKGNASRINRLKRAGACALERIRDPGELEQVFDEIIAIYDFRQGAVNGDCPFADDRWKRGFHLAWIAAATEQLHVTVLRAVDRVVSALVGVIGREAVHVAIITHSPFYARHSPGKFHLMLAGLELASAGIRHLDLTPGGAWKERFADAYDEVFELRIYRCRSERVLATWLGYARTVVKRVIQAVGMDPKAVAGVLATVRRARIASAARLLGRWVRYDAELRLYTILPSAGPIPDPTVTIRKDCIQDLLKFEPTEPWQSRQGFLAAALERLEDGQHVYTISDSQRLLHSGWLVDGQKEMFLTEVGQPFTLPQSSSVLYEFYTDPCARGRGYYRQNLCHMLRDVAVSGTAKQAFICVLADNTPSRRVIEKVGFQYLGSLWHRRRFGRDTRRRSIAEETKVTPGLATDP